MLFNIMTLPLKKLRRETDLFRDGYRHDLSGDVKLIDINTRAELDNKWLDCAKYLFDSMCYFNGSWDYKHETCK